MIKLLATALAVALPLAAAPAHADTAEERYVRDMRAGGYVALGITDDQIVSLGWQTCDVVADWSIGSA